MVDAPVSPNKCEYDARTESLGLNETKANGPHLWPEAIIVAQLPEPRCRQTGIPHNLFYINSSEQPSHRAEPAVIENTKVPGGKNGKN